MYVEGKGGICAWIESSISHSVSYKCKTKADTVNDKKACQEVNQSNLE